MSIHIDSSEVLRHLNSYGIDSIDDKALTSFIKDLKKLIKYEQYRNLYDSKLEQKNISCEQNFADSSTDLVDPLISTLSDHRCEKFCCRKTKKENVLPIYAEEPPKSERIQCQKVQNVSKCKCSCKSTHSQPPLKLFSHSDNITSENTNYERSPELDRKYKTTVDRNNEESRNITRPASLLSYAKSQSGSVRTRKGHCDPVELYHYYQSFWKTHKLPGENDHAQLRLAIRKRLMKVT